MNDAEFNAELTDFFNTERKKQPYSVNPVDDEVRLLASGFAHHVESLKGFYAINTVDEFLHSLEENEKLTEDDDGDFQTPLSYELMELLQRDAERYDAPMEGEIHVQGEGYYIQDTVGQSEDDEYSTVEKLEEGMTIIGDFMGYAALPGLIEEDTEELIVEHDLDQQLEPWIKLYDARVMDSSGAEVMHAPSIFLPLSTTTFRFGTVVRSEEYAHEQKQRQPVEIDLKTYFASDFIRNEFEDAETNLNYNEYSPDEERMIREEYQDEFMLYMEMVDVNNRFVVDATHVYFQNSETGGALEGATANYLQPVLTKIEGEWRLCHAFHILSGDKKGNIAHILPKDLLAIQYKTEG